MSYQQPPYPQQGYPQQGYPQQGYPGQPQYNYPPPGQQYPAGGGVGWQANVGKYFNYYNFLYTY